MNIQVYTLPEALNGLGSTSQPRTSIDLNFNFQSAFRHIFSGSLPTYQFSPAFARGFSNFLYTFLARSTRFRTYRVNRVDTLPKLTSSGNA